MNSSLRSTLGIVALVVAAMVSANEVDAQSNYVLNSGWSSQPTQQFYQSIQTTPQIYHFGTRTTPTYSPQSFQIYRPQTQLQNWSWTPQVATPTIRLGTPLTFPSPTYPKRPVANSTPHIPTTAGVTGCSSGT